MSSLFKFASKSAAAFIALVLISSVAYGADNLIADGDNTVPVAASPVSFGTICINNSGSHDALLALKHSGSSNIFKNSSVVTVSVSSVSVSSGAPAGLSVAASMTTSQITLPSTWEASSNGTMSSSVTSHLIATAGASAGSFSGTVLYDATGTSAATGNPSLTRSGALNFSGTVSNTGSCASDTTAPTVT
ncbi:MAG: hypothetical protein ABIS18_07100, partial [Actinomycetota bacterium]